MLGHPFRASNCIGDPEGTRIASLRQPQLIVPLVVEPTLDCFAMLNELIAAAHEDFCAKAEAVAGTAANTSPELVEAAQVLCAAVRVLRTHAAALQAHGGAAFANRGPIDAARVLLVKVMNGATTAHEELGGSVAQQAADTLAAGLDVFDNEPDIDPAFASLDNVFLLPHLGSATRETRDAMGYRALDNLDAFFAQWVYGAGHPRLRANRNLLAVRPDALLLTLLARHRPPQDVHYRWWTSSRHSITPSERGHRTDTTF